MESGETRAAMETGGTQGRCANHPGQRAVLTCSRCGDYACAACAADLHIQAPLCKRCGGGDLEARRKELGPHERNVRLIALYYWAFFTAFGLAAFACFYVQGSSNNPVQSGTAIGEGLVALMVAAFFGTTAWQLQRFNPLGRVLGSIAALPGLLAVPLGTLISGYTLWALFAKKGKAVFSDEYRVVMALTPHLKYEISIVTKIALGLLGVLIVVAIAAVMMGDV